ncbi:MAG TPA: carbohydrate ABC transporter permease [Chloroflexi bacterium]|nr:carbohydrate ABC transporter permease [Chloroflexota bacterium]
MRLRLSTVLVYLLVGVYTLLVALPIVWMFLSSTKTMRELFTAPFALPSDPQWSNFIRAWESGISHYLANSLLVTSVSVILIVLVSALAAYSLARINFPGRVFIYLLLIAGFAIPVHTVLVPLYRTLNGVNLINTHVGLILPYVAFGIPFSILLLYAFFLEFPAEIEDAARIDGCTIWQLVIQIVMPLSMPALVSVIIFQAVFLWNEFSLALIVIRDDALRTIPLGLTKFQGQWSTNWTLMLASLSMATLPVLLLFVILQRHFIRSLVGFSK